MLDAYQILWFVLSMIGFAGCMVFAAASFFATMWVKGVIGVVAAIGMIHLIVFLANQPALQ